MKKRHLLNGVAVIAALAFSAPVWAQAASPSGGNAMGMPGPNPGGGGLTHTDRCTHLCDGGPIGDIELGDAANERAMRTMSLVPGPP